MAIEMDHPHREFSYPHCKRCTTGVDPGFPVGGAWTSFGGREPPTWSLFGENACENERIGSRTRRGVCLKILYVDPPIYHYM